VNCCSRIHPLTIIIIVTLLILTETIRSTDYYYDRNDDRNFNYILNSFKNLIDYLIIPFPFLVISCLLSTESRDSDFV
jgi:hypothetical protein